MRGEGHHTSRVVVCARTPLVPACECTRAPQHWRRTRLANTKCACGALGAALVREGIAGTPARFPGPAIRNSPQAYLLGFYNALGFEAEGEPYLEDGIAHIGMRLAPARPAVPA